MSTKRWQARQSLCTGRILKPGMQALMVGVALLALTAPMAHAQTSPQVIEPEVAGRHYVVNFGLDQATLTEQDRRIIAQAAEDYRQLGSSRITVTGYTDTSGSPDHNLQLSQHRAEVVADELERNGVPATSIVTVGRGEENLLVATADGVVEPQNRRVEVVVQEPPAPVPVAAAPAPEPAAGPEPEERRANVLTIGPLYGHNFGETNDGAENDLLGGELTYSILPGFLGGVSLKQALLYSFNGDDDGLNGRSVASLDFAPDLGIVRPILAANFGGVYGSGVQDGLVVGPEIGLNLDLIEGVAMRAKVAYDYQFRQPEWDEGILWTGLSFGVSF
jgi:outer membrane protein OmpA-like peptidoglycan-associated protein